MLCNIDNIKNIYEAVSRDNSDIRIDHVDITEEEVSYVEALCHSMFGNMLQIGWQLGKKTDTPSIRSSLSYCGYLGMISKKIRLVEDGKSPQELFESIWENGAFGIDEKIDEILESSISEHNKYTRAFEGICTGIAKPLPKIVDDPNKEIACLDACMAMYFVGKGIVI